MIGRITFDRIKHRHGGYASWAVWADSSGKPKSNIGDIRVLDPDVNPDLLGILRNDVVMVGLNISRPFSEPFRNFHDPNPRAHDFKIRHVFANTACYGAYMTDIIKHVEMVQSVSLMRHLKDDRSIVDRNVKILLEELEDLQCARPTVLAFGNNAHGLLAGHVPRDTYSTLVRLPHYSSRMGKDEYRLIVLAKIAQRGDKQ